MARNDLSLFADDAAGAKEKSPNALRTISEASELLDIPQHVLRFWETKFSQIKPLKRNGGRRFYRPQDLEVLQQIKHLLYTQGYTIKGAQKAISDFVSSRGKDSVPVDRWAPASFPPAHGNDNLADESPVTASSQPEPDILSEIAEILAEPEPSPFSHAVQSPVDLAKLRNLRNELAALRDELVAKTSRAA